MVVQGSASAAATSVAIPTHQAGDLILVFARGTAAAPSIPAAGGTVPAWASVQSGLANAIGLTSAAFVATAANHTTGAWTNATHICVLVLRADAGKTLAVGASSTTNANTTQTIVYPALTMQKIDSTSWCVRCGTRTVAITAVGTPPASYTNQIIQPAGASALMSVHTRSAINANPTADTVTVTSSNAPYRAHSIEVLEFMSLDVADSTTPTDAFSASESISLTDTTTPTEAIFTDEAMGFADVETPTDSPTINLVTVPCRAIVGTFVVGTMLVGRNAACQAAPTLRLIGGAYSVTAAGAGEVVVSMARAVLRLRGNSYTAEGSFSQTIQLGPARLLLVGGPFLLPPPVVTAFGAGVLRLVGKPFALGMGQSITVVNSPVLRLIGGQVNRVGQFGLIPTVPQIGLLTPSPAQVGLLTPTEAEAELLTPTAVKPI